MFAFIQRITTAIQMSFVQRVKEQIVLNVSVNHLCHLWEHLCIYNNPAPLSCPAICHPHKEQQQQFAISSQRKLLFVHSPLRIRGWVTQHKLALWFSICQRGWLILYSIETGCLPLSFKKNESQINAPRPFYYRAYTEHLSSPFWKTQHVCVGYHQCHASPYGPRTFWSPFFSPTLYSIAKSVYHLQTGWLVQFNR